MYLLFLFGISKWPAPTRTPIPSPIPTQQN